jgi:small subunit ribosomal protein S17
MKKRGLPKEKQGVVAKKSGDKSVMVTVSQSIRHPTYKKFVTKTFKFLVHDEKNECGVGDTVIIHESKPISARKRWKVSKVVAKAE